MLSHRYLSPDDPRALTPKVVAAVGKELPDLRERTVWDEPKVTEVADVLASDPQMHVADLFSTVALKRFMAHRRPNLERQHCSRWP